MKRLAALLLVTLILAIGCTGPEGPMGPAGPQGPQGVAGLPGPPGPGTRVVLTSLIGTDGGASVWLPAAAGTNAATPPAMACYITDGSTPVVWLAVADGYSDYSSTCALVFSPTSGRWYAGIIQSISGWTVAFVIVY